MPTRPRPITLQDKIEELKNSIKKIKLKRVKLSKMIKFLDPDYFEINTYENNKFQGRTNLTTSKRKTKKKVPVQKQLETTKKSLEKDNKEERIKLKHLTDVLDKILEDTFFCFRKKHQDQSRSIKSTFKRTFREILDFIFTEDIRLHTMMNLLYEFLISEYTNDIKKNKINFFNFIIQKNLDINTNHINILTYNTETTVVINQIEFLMTKIPNLFKILNYYKSRLANNNLNSTSIDTDKYIYELLKNAMDDIIKLNTYNSTITTNQYEEYLQLKFTEFIGKSLYLPRTPHQKQRLGINVQSEARQPSGTGRQLEQKNNLTKILFGGSSSSSSSSSLSPSPVSNELFIDLFTILGRAINDKDYDEDSKHDELLGGTANEDKAIEQCDAFDFILEKSQFCISDINYKIKENQDQMIEIFDDSIMIFDAGPGIIKPLKYDPWLSRQKGQDNSARKHVHPLQYQSYDFVCSRLKNDEPSSKTLSSSFDAATGGTGLGACLRQIMYYFSGTINNQNFEDIYQNFYDCLFAFVKSTIIIQQNSADDLKIALNILGKIKIVGVMFNGNINCEYTNEREDVIRFKWSSSQSLMAEYINTVVNNQAKPRTKIDIEDEFNKNHFLHDLRGDTQITGNVFHHICRLMKYMGDKAHIACAFFLHLHTDKLPAPQSSDIDRYEPDKKKIEERPKIIITNDRLLFKTIAQVIDFDFKTVFRKNNEDYLQKIQKFQHTFGVIHGRVDGKVSKIMQKSNNFQNLENFDTEEDNIFLFLYSENEINRLKSKIFSLLSIFQENTNNIISGDATTEMLGDMIKMIEKDGGYNTIKQYTQEKLEFDHFEQNKSKIKLAKKYTINSSARRPSRRQNNKLSFMIPVVNTGATSTILEDILTGLFSLIECIECYLTDQEEKKKSSLPSSSSVPPQTRRYIEFISNINPQHRNDIAINIKDDFYTKLFDKKEIDLEISKQKCSQDYFPIPKNHSIIHEYQFNQQDRNRDIYIDQFIQLHELWKKYMKLLDDLSQQNTIIISFQDETMDYDKVLQHLKNGINEIQSPKRKRGEEEEEENNNDY